MAKKKKKKKKKDKKKGKKKDKKDKKKGKDQEEKKAKVEKPQEEPEEVPPEPAPEPEAEPVKPAAEETKMGEEPPEFQPGEAATTTPAGVGAEEAGGKVITTPAFMAKGAAKPGAAPPSAPPKPLAPPKPGAEPPAKPGVAPPGAPTKPARKPGESTGNLWGDLGVFLTELSDSYADRYQLWENSINTVLSILRKMQQVTNTNAEIMIDAIEQQHDEIKTGLNHFVTLRDAIERQTDQDLNEVTKNLRRVLGILSLQIKEYQLKAKVDNWLKNVAIK